MYSHKFMENHNSKSTSQNTHIIRKSPTVLLPDGFKVIILVVISLLGLGYGGNQDVSIASIGLLTLAAIFSFYVWIVWYYDTYILTAAKIIEVKQKGLFSRSVVELPYSAIENASYEISGPLAMMLKVGDVKIHSSISHTINLETIRRPDLVRDEIMRMVGKS